VSSISRELLSSRTAASCAAPVTLIYTSSPIAHDTKILHRVSKNVPPLACYNFDAREWILIFFGSNVTNKVGNQIFAFCLFINSLLSSV